MEQVQGWVEEGAVKVKTSGIVSETKVQGSFPGATVEVVVHNRQALGIVGIQRVANVVTVTMAPGFGFSAGNLVTIAGVTDGSLNGVFTIVSVGGTTFTYAQVGVGTTSSGGTATSVQLATIYSDNLGTAKGNPFVADQTGRWGFFAANGVYDVNFSGTGLQTFTLDSVSVGLGEGGVPSFAFANLPASKSQNAGNLARVTDAQGGLWMDSGVQWVKVLPEINVLEAPFNARGDNSTDDTTAIQNAINQAGNAGGGLVIIPFTASGYKVASTLTLKPYVRLEGRGDLQPTINFTGGSGTLFNFLGASEAQALNVEIEYLQLVSSSAGSGVGIRVRNFNNIFATRLIIANFNEGLWADWGIGVYVDECVIVNNIRGLQTGGGTGGIRGGVFASSPFMDSVSVMRTAFSQNQVDINDAGSTNSDGGLTIQDCSFFEDGTVPSKVYMAHIAGRPGINIKSNWFEQFTAGNKCLSFKQFDYDANFRGECIGAHITGNVFRMQGGSGSTGVYDVRCASIYIGENQFNMGNSPAGYAIDIQDTTSPATIGDNGYYSYSGGGYTKFINQATDYSLFLTPTPLVRVLGTAGSPSADFFVILPGGLILQWGAVGFNITATPTWTFPKAFPTRCVWAACMIADPGTNHYATVNSDIVFTQITTSIQFRMDDNTTRAVDGQCFAIGF